MDKEDVIQKVNDYCTEKQYTLDDSFRSQFSEKFANSNADADVNDENILNSIKFNIDTAFSAASKELKIKDETWKTKEAEYQKQIEALKKSHHDGEGEGKGRGKTDPPEFKLSDDDKNLLDELKKFKIEKQQQEKRAKVLDMAKSKVRTDLHPDLEEILNIMQLDYSKDEKELAEMLNSNFSKLYKGKIGDVRPVDAQSQNLKDEDIIKGVKKVEIK